MTRVKIKLNLADSQSGKKNYLCILFCFKCTKRWKEQLSLFSLCFKCAIGSPNLWKYLLIGRTNSILSHISAFIWTRQWDSIFYILICIIIELFTGGKRWPPTSTSKLRWPLMVSSDQYAHLQLGKIYQNNKTRPHTFDFLALPLPFLWLQSQII